LAYNGTPTWQHYLYILIYILFYIIDDIIVFIIAMITLQTTTISTKYAKYSNLIGGVVILLLGLVLLFRPEWLLWG
jgi:threonine/homoserine/homoserine lactone efflux protein